MTLNNLNAVRLVAAGMVLYGRSFIFLGLPEPRFLSWAPLGPIGVYIFFIISGYLVIESWDRDPHLIRFFQRRLLRIIPGLAVCVLFTILVLGPLLTTLPLPVYFAHEYTRGYLQNIALHIVYALPGVFETNKVQHAVNGSIWSLPVEFFMYIVVVVLGLLRGNRWVFAAMAVGSAMACILWADVTKDFIVFYNFEVKYIFICGTYFWIGACFFKFKLHRYLTLSGAMVAMVALLCLEPFTQQLAWAAWVLLPVVVLTFGFAYSPVLGKLTSSGDYSYGIYIYAFPIQQAVVYWWPQLSVTSYIVICSFATLFFAIVSWHFIERRALAFKPRRPWPADPHLRTEHQSPLIGNALQP
jgi:peptidoglycan/LPS O-acetylase OafA/YrhL